MIERKMINNYDISQKKIMFYFEIFIFFYAINLMNVGRYLPLLILPFCIFLFFNKEYSRNFIVIFGLYMAFNSIYFIISYVHGFYNFISLIGKIIYPSLFLLLGYFIVGKELHEKRLIRLLIYVMMGISWYAILSAFKTFFIFGGFDNTISTMEGRVVLTIWGDGRIAATALNGMLSLSLASLPVLLIRSKEINRFEKISLIITFILSCYITVNLANRTGILIILISILSFLFLSEQSNIKKIFNLIKYGFISFVVLIIYNFTDLKTIFEGTYLFSRLKLTELGEDGRINAWIDSFTGLFINPLGGRVKNLDIGYAHNFWLDIGYDGGLIPFIILVGFTLHVIIVTYQTLKKIHCYFLKNFLLSIFSGYFVVFMFEPVFQGLIDYFSIFCFIVGMIYKIHYLQNRKKAVNNDEEDFILYQSNYCKSSS